MNWILFWTVTFCAPPEIKHPGQAVTLACILKKSDEHEIFETKKDCEEYRINHTMIEKCREILP